MRRAFLRFDYCFIACIDTLTFPYLLFPQILKMKLHHCKKKNFLRNGKEESGWDTGVEGRLNWEVSLMLPHLCCLLYVSKKQKRKIYSINPTSNGKEHNWLIYCSPYLLAGEECLPKPYRCKIIEKAE